MMLYTMWTQMQTQIRIWINEKKVLLTGKREMEVSKARIKQAEAEDNRPEMSKGVWLGLT